MENYTVYQEWIKPFWAPSVWVFSPVWTALYIGIVLTFGYVAYLWFQKKIPFIIFLPFLLNLAFNLAFTPIQFGLRNNYLATLDIVLVLITLLWALKAIHPYARWVTYVNVPYVLWVGFATVLQIAITLLN